MQLVGSMSLLMRLSRSASAGPRGSSKGDRWGRQHCRNATTGAAIVDKAAALVIGDEILSGAIADTNTPWLAKFLHSQGVDMVRFEYVPDRVDAIVDALRRLKSIVGPSGVIFTSGGIGPTHDDVTYEAVSTAFSTKCELHKATLDRMHQHYSNRGLEVNEARKRMATLPADSEVLFTEALCPHWVPLVQHQNVYVLPGIPKLYKAMVSGHRERFVGQQHHQSELRTHLGEGDIADAVRELAAASKGVHIGSYPSEDPDALDGYKVRVVVTGRSRARVDETTAQLQPILQAATR